ncbi:MAG: hypothetical protein AB8E87_07220 [Prochlorococcus sp.]
MVRAAEDEVLPIKLSLRIDGLEPGIIKHLIPLNLQPAPAQSSPQTEQQQTQQQPAQHDPSSAMV